MELIPFYGLYYLKMGDSRIKILIAKELLGVEKDVHISKVFSSDTTIREVIENATQLFDLFQSKLNSFYLWDATVNPPKNITNWPMKEFPETYGPRSKTLHAAGCFPSANWLVLPIDLEPNKFKTAEYDDTQYNLNQRIIEPSGTSSTNDEVNHRNPTIQFKDSELASSKPLPSEVMQSVTRRFDNDDQHQLARDAGKAELLRRENQERRRLHEKERAAKLDQRIQKLEEESTEKNKKVSDQVKKMLVKSRATGAKTLKMQDRMYFECLIDDGDDDLRKEYRFFSPQETFAKIASTFTSTKGLNNQEVLRRNGNTFSYQRFPVAMRVYEAISAGFLSDNLDTLIIRCYNDDESPTTSILEAKSSESIIDAAMETQQEISNDDEAMAVDMESPSPEDNALIIIKDETLTETIKKMDEELNKGKKAKKKSAAAIKVRNMQMKSKAKGDAKRIPKVEDRFYLEIVMVSLDGVASSSFHFFSKKDTLERLLQLVVPASKRTTDWTVLVPNNEEEESTFKRIEDLSVVLKEAEETQILKCFDRMILQPKL